MKFQVIATHIRRGFGFAINIGSFVAQLGADFALFADEGNYSPEGELK